MEAKIAEFRQVAQIGGPEFCRMMKAQADAAAAAEDAQLVAEARGAPVALRLENYEVLAFLGKGAYGTYDLPCDI